MTPDPNLKLSFHPLTSDRWKDIEALFGPLGACGGCWCMSWRLKRADFVRQKGEGNKRALKEIVDTGEVPGIIAYDRDQPVAWCSFAPRASFPALQRSRTLAPIDDQPVWSVVCFFILKLYRNKGVSAGLLTAVIQHVKNHGGKIIEGYPVEPVKGRWPDVFAWTGLASSFRKAGFVEVQRRTSTRPMMRYYVEGLEQPFGLRNNSMF